MTKLQLSPGELNALQTAFGVLSAFGAWLGTNVASFPLNEQALVSFIGGAIGYFAADGIAELKGQSVTAATVATQIASIYTPAQHDALVTYIKTIVTDPVQQKIALATLAEVELKLQAYTPPPSPLAAAVQG